MSEHASKPRATVLEFAFFLAAGGVALTWGYLEIQAWAHAGENWPTWFFAHLGLLLLFSFKRPRPDSAEGRPVGAAFERFASLVLAVLVWALSIEFATSTAAVPSALDFGGGPILRPFVALLGLGLGWYAFGGPTPPRAKARAFVFAHTLAERSLVLFAILCTANGKLFLKTGSSGFSLILVLGLVTAVLLGRGQSLRQLFAALIKPIGKPALAALFLLPLWWWIAAVNAAAPANAVALAWRLIVPAVVAALAMATLTKDGIRRVFGAIVFGFGCALFAGLLGVFEALAFCSLEEILGSRLRILGLHPNLGAALLAIGLPITLGWILTAPKGAQLRRRWIGSLLFAMGMTALYLTASRAGGIGAIFSLLALLAFALTALPKQLSTKRLMGISLAGAALFALFLTPLGDGVRSSLDAKAQTQSAIGQRWHIWKMATDAALEHPVTGIGPVGFAGHAQYAEPSYYDGTSQTLHTHNIFLAAVSGAGFPGLFLFVAWLVAFFGLGFRAILSEARGHPQLASVVAAALGLLVCNLFDLGQSQLTFLPLFYWIALALFGARARLSQEAAEVSEPVLSLAVPLACILALWPTAIGTLGGSYLTDSAAKKAQAGDYPGSNALLEMALLPSFSQQRSETRTQLAHQYSKQGQVKMRLATLQKGVEEARYSAPAQRRFAEALLAAGRFGKGAEAADRAFELDPRGAFIGPTCMLQAWAAFELGNVTEGAAFLVQGFASEAKPPKGMRFTRSEADESVSFAVKDGAPVALASILDQLGGQLVELAGTDEVRARRELTGLIEGYQFNHDPATAAPWIRRVIEASEKPIRATYFQEIEVLLAAGQDANARAVWEGMDLGEDTNLADVFSDLFSEGGEVKGRQLAVSGLDIFFVAGQLVDTRLDWAIRLAAEGQRKLAVHEVERAIYDSASFPRRTRVAYDFLCKGAGTPEQRIEDLVRFLKYSAYTRKASGDAERFRFASGVLIAAFEGDLAAVQKHAVAALERAGGHGDAGLNFLDTLDKELAKRRKASGN